MSSVGLPPEASAAPGPPSRPVLSAWRHDLFDGHRPLGVRHRVQALRRGERSIGRGSGGVDELLAVLNSGYTEARKRERRVREWLVTLALEPPPGFSSADGEWVLVDD